MLLFYWNDWCYNFAINFAISITVITNHFKVYLIYQKLVLTPINLQKMISKLSVLSASIAQYTLLISLHSSAVCIDLLVEDVSSFPATI